MPEPHSAPTAPVAPPAPTPHTTVTATVTATAIDTSTATATDTATATATDTAADAATATAIAQQAQATGHAPWQRTGASVPPPDDPAAVARADRWRRAAADMDHAPSVPPPTDRQEQRRRRAADRKRRKEEAEAEAAQKLEANARRMYLAGFFALPLLWLVTLLYFHKEHTSPNANPVIKKYYRNSRFMLIVYTIIFVTWFVVFQVKSDTSLKSLNILYFEGKSPSGF